MLLAIVVVNLILSCIVVGHYLKRLSPLATKALNGITAFIFVFILISFLYYAMLIAGASFAILVSTWTIINLSGLFLIIKQGEIHKKSFTSHGVYSRNTTIVLTGVLIITVYFVLHASKYGNWDAWAIWNLHAKFLYAGNGWKNMFGKGLEYSHRDYPLMLPSLVAFFWKAVGRMSPLVPLGLAWLIMVAIPVVIYYELADGDKTGTWPILALLIFVTDHNYQSIGAYQVADPLLSLLILLSFIWLKNRKPQNTNGVYVIAFICASCVWLKNEGSLFYLVFSAGFVIAHLKRQSDIFKYLAGSLLPIAVAISFKVLYAPGNDLVNASHANTAQLLGTLSRYTTIAKAVLNMLVDNYAMLLALLSAALLFSRKYFSSFTFVVICIMISGYAFIYLTTPYDLDWHLSTSLNRLFQHFYPAIIYSGLLSLKNSGKIFFSTGPAV